MHHAEFGSIQYLNTRDEGLGTTYERFILHSLFEKIHHNYGIESVVEVPCYGMTGLTGINSMWWAIQGVQVTVIDDNEQRVEIIKKLWNEAGLKANVEYQPSDKLLVGYGDKQFDMCWNFASLWYVKDIEQFFQLITRVTRKVIFICVPNRVNIGYWFRKRSLKKEGLNLENIDPASIVNEMEKLNWKLVEGGYFDVPPWPDIAMKKEELLDKIGLRWLAMKIRNKGNDGICILDYYSGKKQNMEKDILKYSFLENTFQPLKRIWAHHRYFLFTHNEL